MCTATSPPTDAQAGHSVQPSSPSVLLGAVGGRGLQGEGTMEDKMEGWRGWVVMDGERKELWGVLRVDKE